MVWILAKFDFIGFKIEIVSMSYLDLYPFLTVVSTIVLLWHRAHNRFMLV